ncbi:hypothetical protein E2562_003044 [Oryza meyeriana var. granulata]|uniref:Uncharacterized protein n=1 Tax=Oryza meyeriana var. granulata TaxID=110450 RepID=A0A6G1DEI5_9ORYZ|nr:hypothetical protein E2562_003044 [Oryza meyeriana var. granulata]
MVEEDDDDDDFVPLSHARGRKKASDAAASKTICTTAPGNEKQKITGNSNAKAKKKGAAVSNAKSSKVKKIKDEDLEDDIKKIKKKADTKEDGKKGPATRKGDAEKVKKEKRVYDLPGQKHDPPPERDPLRIFYESLYQQVPTRPETEVTTQNHLCKEKARHSDQENTVVICYKNQLSYKGYRKNYGTQEEEGKQ